MKASKMKFTIFAKNTNCDFNNTICFLKEDRNFANNTIGFRAHFTTLDWGEIGVKIGGENLGCNWGENGKEIRVKP